MFGDGEIVMSIRKQRLLLLNSSALKLLCCAGVAPSHTLLKCHTLRGNEFRGVDKNGSGFFHRSCSGAPVALTGQKGIRCDSPFRWRGKSGAAPATVGGESFFKLPLGYQSLGRRRRTMTREPGDLPEHVIFRRTGRAHGAVFRRGDRRAVERMGVAAMDLPIVASDQTPRARARTVGFTAALALSVFGLSTGFGPAAQAAEVSQPWGQLVLKAPARATSQFDWTGFYVGGHVGYARGNARVNTLNDDTDSFRSRFGSLTGGLQGGYNYVLPSRLLLGVEADMSFLNFLSADEVAWLRTTPDTDIAERIDYMGTVRGRVGYAFDHWMVYATGGFAWSLGRFLQTPGAVDDIDKLLHLHTGWAAGAGAEFAIAPMWTARLEYLYRNFGHAEVTFPSGTTAGSSYDLHAIRAGLSYKLGAPTAFTPDFAASQTQ